ncbi:surface glycoprotein, putative [Trypanosoma cruzi marinkellei]|uniref:Surface glycoprotein, putative n=1 Tax=Trypanosoma cruzi marinkellei TaxID=85056 RepID=K2NVI5_TRYCR|nr:surface glycoprotein, putative [Trypanosoma cruzi marinkellei]
MCLFGIVDAVGDFFKSVVACACCLIIGGPALIIAGSILVSQQDNRKAFSDAVKQFNPTPLNAWTGTINNLPVTVRRESLNVKGGKGATSVFAEAVFSVSDRSSSEFPVSVNVNTVTPFTRKVAFHVLRNSTYSCSSSDCKNGKDCQCRRDVRSFGDKCTTRGGIFNAAPTWCEVGHICGDCLETVYLRRVYLVVSEVGNGK